MAPVFVNGRGPYAFVVDTGASRSVIAPRVAAELGLVPQASRPLALRGVTGGDVVPSVLVESLAAGDLILSNQRLPVVAPNVFADADGILGVEGFERMCLEVDFQKQQISIRKNGCPAAGSAWARARARMIFGRLITVRARIGRTPVRAIIDTGAEHSLGNRVLLRALELEPASDAPPNARVLGATHHTTAGSRFQAPPIYIGEIRIGNLNVTFGDLDVFRLWRLETEPAIVLGMDVLGAAAGLMIDYRRRELRILPHDGRADPALRMRETPTRIP